ncbi:TcfC E-set like domain-containing protein [Enterobacter bugandensis]|uniref:TcfC E-set like domain-containing protein n=1 Tax=Enterobacter bugandensis TaxID=881260 RepID=UPI002FD0178C
MLFRLSPLFIAITTCSASAYADSIQPARILAEQVEAMPEDFQTHFFNTPLSTRVMLDGKVLGDATVMLTKDEKVQIISFTDEGDAFFSVSDRQHWQDKLNTPVPLGLCETGCPTGLTRLDFNLASMQLSLMTPKAGDNDEDRWYSLPENAGAGMMLNSQLSATGGQEQSNAFGWLGGIEAGLGSWTGVGQLSADRSSGGRAETRHAVSALYLMRESKHTFYRAGLFMPDSQGLLRQPYRRSGNVTTIAGVMTGSSDTLLKAGNTPALFPVYVTANREGVVEVWRDGRLINTQPVNPGLQAIDTTSLPGGVYDVEVKVLEDGREISRATETINKPAGWRSPGQRLRYNLFAGRETNLWSSDRNGQQEQRAAAGASINWLVQPAITAGAAVQKTGREEQAGVSLDWQATTPLHLYGSVWHSNVTGKGFDSQAMYVHDWGSLSFNHSRSWYQYDDGQNHSSGRKPRTEQTTSLSGTARLHNAKSLNARLTHHSDSNGIGLDVGITTRTRIGETDVSWRLSGFDRPYSEEENLRNRGISLSASFALGGNGRSATASLGSRTDIRGGRDLYASASVSQEWENRILKQSSVTVTGDRHGTGLSAFNSFEAPVASGSFWGQRSSQRGDLSGGINMSNTLALGQGKAMLSAQSPYHQGGGMIVDIKSDDPDARLMAYHDSGNTELKPGRNFIPVSAWKPGTVALDFPGDEAPALKVIPQQLSYHHVRGGVSSHEVKVMKTVTVMGRITDVQGNPLGGAQVVNHAGRTVTEADGLFTLELHEKNPVIEVSNPSGTQCEIHLDPQKNKQGEIMFAGNMKCG